MDNSNDKPNPIRPGYFNWNGTLARWEHGALIPKEWTGHSWVGGHGYSGFDLEATRITPEEAEQLARANGITDDSWMIPPKQHPLRPGYYSWNGRFARRTEQAQKAQVWTGQGWKWVDDLFKFDNQADRVTAERAEAMARDEGITDDSWKIPDPPQ